MGRTACTESQCMYKGALYLFLTRHPVPPLPNELIFRNLWPATCRFGMEDPNLQNTEDVVMCCLVRTVIHGWGEGKRKNDRWVWSNGWMVISRGKPNKLGEKLTWLKLCPSSNMALNQWRCTVKREFVPETLPRFWFNRFFGSVSVFVIRTNTTLSALCIHLSSATCFGLTCQKWPKRVVDDKWIRNISYMFRPHVSKMTETSSRWQVNT
jgi:hypothetical protein